MLSSDLRCIVSYTPLLRARNIEKLYGESLKIYLKWEGNNLTHTHKDRAAKIHIANAIRNNYKEITVGTCGNFGVAIAYYAYLKNLKTTIFVPSKYVNSRVNEMLKYHAKIIYVNGTYEDAVYLSTKYSYEKGVYNANPGLNSVPSIIGYRYISYEIFKQLGDAPYAVSIPVGNGTTLTGIYEGFLVLYKEGMTTTIPRIIATSTSYGNQIVESWYRGNGTLIKLNDKDIRETIYNEPLVSYRSLDGERALNAIEESKGKAYAFSDEELLKAYDVLKRLEGLKSLPASASSLLGIERFVKEENIEKENLVSLITGGEHTWRTR